MNSTSELLSEYVTLTDKPVLVVKDLEQDVELLTDLLSRSGLGQSALYCLQTKTLAQVWKQEIYENEIVKCAGNYEVILYISNDAEILKSISAVVNTDSIPLLSVYSAEGSINVHYDLGAKINYRPVNLGIFGQHGHKVHVGAVTQDTEYSIVACDYPHGAESGDLLALTDGDIQGLPVNTVLSPTTFTVQNTQGIRQGNEVKLVRRTNWSTLPQDFTETPDGALGLPSTFIGGEVAGFLVDQLTRVLVSPGWIQSPAKLSLSTPSNLEGRSVLILGASDEITVHLHREFTRLNLARLVVSSTKNLPPELYQDPESQVSLVENASNHNLSQFDLVVCSSGDFNARRSIGDQCVADQKPLIMLAQDSFRGQLESFVPHKTVSYSCLADPVDSETPYCILKSFPHRGSHAAVWARDKVDRMFIQKPRARNTFIQEHKGNLVGLSQLIAAARPPQGARETQFFLTSCGETASWSSCVTAARLRFDKYFSTKAVQLTASFDANAKMSDGSDFWSWPKLIPRPVVFDPSDPVHSETVVQLATAFATVLNVDIPHNTDLIHLASQVEVPKFSPKRKKIVTDETAKKDDSPVDNSKDYSGLPAYLRVAEPVTAQPPSRLIQALIVNFTYLRCDMYGIPRPSASSVLQSVHNVQKCTAALSSQLAALAVHHASGVLGGEEGRSVWLCGGERVEYSTPLPTFTSISPDLRISIWDVWEIQGNSSFTLQMFLDAMLNKYSVKVSLVVQDTRMVFLPIMPNHKSRLPKPMVDLLKNPGNQDHIFLSLNATVDQVEEDITLPRVKYIFQNSA